MRLGKDIEDKPIVSVADGRILGRAKDVFVDANLSNLVGLFIGTEGVIRRRTKVIDSSNVVLFGIDVTLVKNSTVIVNDQDLPEVKEWIRLKDLQGREVLTPGGTKLGSVGDVILDETGKIVGLHLSRIHVKGPLAEQGTIPRETIVNPNQEDGTIGVDLALLEKMVGGVEEEGLNEDGAKSEKEMAAEEVEEEDVEEIPVEIVDSEDAGANEEGKDESTDDDNGEAAEDDQ